MSNATSVKIIPSEDILKPCDLNLMPFRINYSGSAPIQLYFRPMPATESFPGQDAPGLVSAMPSNSQIMTEKKNEGSGTCNCNNKRCRIHSCKSGTEVMALEIPTSPAAPTDVITTFDSAKELVKENDAAVDEDGQTPNAMDIDQPPLESTLPSTSSNEPNALFSSVPPGTGASETGRMTAAFRGRTVQGMRVALPAGFGGLVLRSSSNLSSATSTSHVQASSSTIVPNADLAQENANKNVVTREKKMKQAAAAAKARARRTARRGGTTTVPDSEPEPEGAQLEEAQAESMQLDVDSPSVVVNASVADVTEETDGEPLEQTESKDFLPTATFNSFVLWNADFPVDAGKDEYLRTLTEWTSLSAEVRPFIVVVVIEVKQTPVLTNWTDPSLLKLLTMYWPSLMYLNMPLAVPLLPPVHGE
jgi:hypothetical protein